MKPNDQRTAPAKPRPDSQPHGTTQDQVNEMESEGQGGIAKCQGGPTKKGPKPIATPQSERPPKGSIPARWHR